MNDRYDLIVVGAGILGLAHAGAGASRGLSVWVRGTRLGVRRRIDPRQRLHHGHRSARGRQLAARDALTPGLDRTGAAGRHAIVQRGPYLVAQRPAAASLLDALSCAGLRRRVANATKHAMCAARSGRSPSMTPARCSAVRMSCGSSRARPWPNSPRVVICPGGRFECVVRAA